MLRSNHQSTSKALLRALSSLLMLAGAGWVIYLLGTSIDDPRRFIPANLTKLSFATLLIACSFMTNWFLFHAFLCGNTGTNCTVWTSIRLHTGGQLLRYLPGKIWGIAYQIATTQGEIPAARIARANIDFMAFTLLGNSAVSLIVLGIWQDTIDPPMISIGVCLLILQLFLFLGGASWILEKCEGILPVKLHPIIRAINDTPFTLSRLLAAQFVYTTGWLLYLWGWTHLSVVFPNFAHIDFVVLAIYYTLASIVGILSIVTPAGLGVREAVFLLLAAGSIDQGVAAFIATFGRFWLMLIDTLLLILVTLVFHIATKFRRTSIN